MKALLLRASRRFYWRHPWQLALAVTGIALGVAVYVGVALANDSARRAFEMSSQAVLGLTTHRLLPVGGALPEQALVELVRGRGISAAAPIIEAELLLEAGALRRYRLLGVDPLKEPGVRGFTGLVPGSAEDAARLIAEPGTVLLPSALAEELALVRGSRLEASVAGRSGSVTVAGTVRSANADAEPPIVGDIATVQALTGRIGFLDRVDLRLDEETAARLADQPPVGTVLVPVGAERGFDDLTRAFLTNLTALGLLALVVGMFLIYSTMSFTIVQRRSVLGALLALGLDRRQLLATVLLEALALGVAATAAGLLLGHGLARGLLDLVLRTIGDLNFSARVTAAAPSPWIFAQGAALGIAATLAAALGPAFDAARAAPDVAMRRAALERRSRRRVRLAAWTALPVLAAGALALAVDQRSLYPAFAGLFCVLLGGALLTPASTALLMRAVEPAAGSGFGIGALLAVRGVTASLSRTGVATAALAVAVATVVGIGLMISSFRASLVAWLDTTLTADLYVSLPAEEGSEDQRLLEWIRALPNIAGVSPSRSVRLPTAEGEIGLRAAAPGPKGWGLDVVAGEAGLAELEARPSVAVTEPFAFRRGLDVGGELELPTPRGPMSFPIIAIYRDYSTSGASVLIALRRYREIWNDARLTSVGVHVAPGADRAEIGRTLGNLLPPSADGRIRSTEGIVELSLAVFDRTFEITEVLRILAAVIAFLGVLSALLSIELEKSRELAVLRAIGFGPAELGTLTLTQTTLLGAAAGLAAAPIGAVLAALLVHVINRRSFGWSMELVVAPGPLVSGFALAVAAALVAGLYPALRMRRAELGAALREE